MARVNEGSHSFTTTHTLNEPYLPLFPSHRAPSHFGWYSFLVPLRVGGWVGLGGLVKYWGGLPTQRRSPNPVLTAATENRTCNHRIASPTPYPLDYWTTSNDKAAKLSLLITIIYYHHHTHHNHFMALFPGPPGWAGARRELLDFMVQAKINRGRYNDHPAGRHSIRTNQCPPPPSSQYILQAGCPSCRPTNSIKALKATSAFRLGRRHYSAH